MDIWTWISDLPNSDDWNHSNSVLTFKQATSNDDSTQSIQLVAERIIGQNSEINLTFSFCCVGFRCFEEEETVIWTSQTCDLGSDKPFLPLVLQLLEEIVSRSPTADGNTCPRSQLENLRPEPVSWILDSHTQESFSGFFNLIFLTHLFWLCAWDSPSEVGSFYFRSLLSPNVDEFSCKQSSILRNFFVAIGIDFELCFVRAFGYMLAKWLILKDVEVGFQHLTPFHSIGIGLSYATETHGLWVLKGYSPVKSMNCMQCKGQNSQFPGVIEATESLLKYALAHQQLEAVIQLEYTVGFYDNHIKVNARVDNIRLHVVKLGFNKDSDKIVSLEEKYFPSRIRIWIGPEVGACYVGGLSLSRSTDNIEREMEMEKVLKGSHGSSKGGYKVKAMEKMATRTRFKNWRWDQDVEGNAAVFDAVLCDNATGIEIATWKPAPVDAETMISLRNRYRGGGRAFTKSGGMVFSGEEYGENVGWRLGKEVEGSVLKWRIGGKVWVTYLANDVRTSYYETRCIEWCDEVDLPLIPSGP